MSDTMYGAYSQPPQILLQLVSLEICVRCAARKGLALARSYAQGKLNVLRSAADLSKIKKSAANLSSTIHYNSKLWVASANWHKIARIALVSGAAVVGTGIVGTAPMPAQHLMPAPQLTGAPLNVVSLSSAPVTEKAVIEYTQLTSPPAVNIKARPAIEINYALPKFDGSQAAKALPTHGFLPDETDCGLGVRHIAEATHLNVRYANGATVPRAKDYAALLPKRGWVPVSQGKSGNTFNVNNVRESVEKMFGDASHPVFVVMRDTGDGHIFYIHSDDNTYSGFQQPHKGTGLKNPGAYSWTAFAYTGPVVNYDVPAAQVRYAASRHSHHSWHHHPARSYMTATYSTHLHLKMT